MLGQLRNRADDLLIGLLLGPVPLGYYVVAKKLVSLVADIVGGVFAQVTSPLLAAVKADSNRLKDVYVRSVGTATVLLTFTYGLVAVLSPVAVPLIFGEAWAAAGTPAALLALAGPVTALAVIDRALLIAAGRIRLELAVTAAILLVQVAVVAGAAPYGITVVAAAAALRAYTTWPIRLLVVAAATPVSTRDYVSSTVRVWLIGLTSVGTSFAVLWTADLDGVLHLSVACATYLLVSAALLTLFARSQVRSCLRIARSVLTRRRHVAHNSQEG